MTAARWNLDDEQLSIQEQGQAQAAEDLVREVDSTAWERLRLKLSRRPGRSGWSVRAAQYVGVARLEVGARGVPVEIRPKMPADVFFLAERAFGVDERNAVVDRRLRADLEVIRRDPTACLVAWFLADVEAFALRFLRRAYRQRREVIEGGLRERLLLEDYVATSLAEGRPYEVPCEFPALTLDTPANRAIRATVQIALHRCGMVKHPEARTVLKRRGRRVLSLLAGVPNERLRTGTFRAIRWEPQPRHYRRILAHCEAFASGLYMDLEVGSHDRQAFLWDMNLLFQEALRGILAGWDDARLEAHRPSAIISDFAGGNQWQSKVDPDFVLRRGDGTRFVLDAKYKDTEVAVEDREEIAVADGRVRLARADVYQVVAYRAHRQYEGATAGLVFPVVLEAGQELPRPYCVSGFGDPVHLFFCDVGQNAEENLPQFFDALGQPKP